jgi:hypothetical protein
MPNVNVQFLGQTLVIPGSYYADNVSATLPNSQGSVPPLIFIGYGYGVQPQTPMTYVVADDLLAAIRGGPCVDFVQFLTNPSTVLNGASFITYINVGKNTQSTVTLADANGLPAIDLVSADYGLPSNLLQAEVSAGAIPGAINLTLYDGYSGKAATGLDLGVPFQLGYVGTAASGVSFTVAVSGTAFPQFSVASPIPGESVTVPLGAGGYAKVSDIVQYLNGTGFYVATAYSDPDLPTSALDNVSNIELPAPAFSGSTATPTFVSVTAGLGDVVYWINQFGQNFATATMNTDAVANSGDTLATLPLLHFSGAASVPPLLADYAQALTLSLSTPGWVIFCDSNDPGVIALGVSTAVTSAKPGQNTWRRFISGSSLGDSVTEVTTQARAMNAYQATYVYPGVYRTDALSGQNTLFSGLYAAAAVAGIMSGNVVAQPLTNQSLVGTGVEVLLDLSDINTLQTAGVMPIRSPSSTKLPTIVSDLTTWQADNNPENVFNQQVGCRFALAYSLQQGLQPYVGSIADPFNLTRMKNTATSILNQLIYSPGNNGILISWDSASLILTYDGATQAVTVKVNVVFVGQVRFILELTFVQPLSLTA